MLRQTTDKLRSALCVAHGQHPCMIAIVLRGSSQLGDEVFSSELCTTKAEIVLKQFDINVTSLCAHSCCASVLAVHKIQFEYISHGNKSNTHWLADTNRLKISGCVFICISEASLTGCPKTIYCVSVASRLCCLISFAYTREPLDASICKQT